MNEDQAMWRMAEEYLAAVERALEGRPESVRRELLAELKDHIAESVRRAVAAGEPVGEEMMGRILGEMDAPESYAEAGGDVQEAGTSASSGAAAGSGSRSGNGGGGRWFLLALAFLLVNAFGVWKWTCGGGTGCMEGISTGPEKTTEAVDVSTPQWERVLRLRKVTQMDISSDREVLLQLAFNVMPDRERLTRFLILTADREEVKYRVAGVLNENTVVVETEPVLTEELELKILQGLPAEGEEGTRPMDRDETTTIRMTKNMVFEGVETESPAFENPWIGLKFNVIPEMGRVKDFIRVEPATVFTAEAEDGWRWSGLKLRGAFKPGEIYEVTLKEGLPARNGGSLPREVTRQIQITLPEEHIRVDVPGRYLSPRGGLRVPVRATRVQRFNAKLMKGFANNLVWMSAQEKEFFYYNVYNRELEKSMAEVGSATNLSLRMNADGMTAEGEVSLRDLMGGETACGVYLLTVKTEKGERDSRLLAVTDLGLAMRNWNGGTFGNGAVVWVNSLRTAEAVAGARVTVWSRQNQVLAQGETDVDGLARLTWTGGGEEDDGNAFLVTAEKEGDLSFLEMWRDPLTTEEKTVQTPYLREGLEAAVFTERGIYRPGETVRVQALVRDREMRAPEAFPAVLRVTRPDGKVFRDVAVMLDGFGAGGAEVTLPEYLPTGRYTFTLAMPGTFAELGVTSAALEDFVPPQIRVKLTPPEGRTAAGETRDFQVESEFLFGAAAAGLTVSAGGEALAVPFAPEQWKGWTFGDDLKVFAGRTLAEQKGVLNGGGKVVFPMKTTAGWRPPAALRILLWGTVTEPGGRTVTEYGSATMDAYPFYVGLKPSWNKALRIGETQRVSVVEVLPDGQPVPAEEAKALVVRLSRVSWLSVLKKESNGKCRWESERQSVDVRVDTLAAGGTATEWAFAAEAAGAYTLTFEDPASGASSSLSFFAGGEEASWGEWSRENPGRIELTADRKGAYRGGETAQIQIRAPFSGPALVTVEGSNVREAQRVMLEGNTAEVAVKVEEKDAPNLYVTVTMIRPAETEEVWSAHRATGTVFLPVERADRRLKLEWEAPERMEPQQTLEVAVKVMREDGTPAQGSVFIWAVDEGICRLTDYKTPDPMDVFLAQRRLAVYGRDFYADLMPERKNSLVGMSAPGGDSAMALRKRLNPVKANRFKPVSLWAEPVALDAEGCARVRLAVPEFTGKLRLMAVAYNATQTGTGDRALTVKRDLVVLPALPRFLATGDRCTALLPVYNESAADRKVDLRVTCGGPLEATPAEQTLDLSAGQSSRAEVGLMAGKLPGKALCTIEAGGVYRDTIELPVRPAGGTRTEQAWLTLEPGTSATVRAPKKWMKESVTFSGVISSLPSLDLGRALDYVTQYPYGCLEQTVSGAFPLLKAAEWTGRLAPGGQAIGDPVALVEAAVRRVLSMQTRSGGFTLWPFVSGEDKEASLYAIHFLLEARKAGFEVSDDPLNNALRWVREELDTTLPVTSDEAEWRRAMQARAQETFLLALAGQSDAGWMARLEEQADRLDMASRAFLASALLLSGEPRRAVTLMTDTGMPEPRPRDGFASLDSDIRDAALLLSAWLDVDAENEAVGRLAHVLRSRRTDGHWGNTQNNAMALLAFGKLARHLPAEERPFAGSVSAGGSGLPQTFALTNEFRWTDNPGGTGEIIVSNAGPGKAYAWITMTGTGLTPEPESQRGISIQRTVLDGAQNEIDPSEVSLGQLLVIRLDIDSFSPADQLVIEDLLPAGWEVENANLNKSQRIPWLSKYTDAAVHREIRDDRVLFFTGPLSGKQSFYYAARAVTAGTFTQPPATVSGMYNPAIRAVGASGTVRVTP